MRQVNQRRPEGRVQPHAARVTVVSRARASAAVRAGTCPDCGARTCIPCQAAPAGDHLARWLNAEAEGRISGADLIAAVGTMTVVIRSAVVAEVAA